MTVPNAMVFEALRALKLDDQALMRECEISVFVASGPGGQHRNKTESGVRLTHLPTQVTLTATERRSQLQNRDVALERLRAVLKRMSYVKPTRKPTKPTRSSQRRRVADKKAHGEKKQQRTRSFDD